MSEGEDHAGLSEGEEAANEEGQEENMSEKEEQVYIDIVSFFFLVVDYRSHG